VLMRLTPRMFSSGRVSWIRQYGCSRAPVSVLVSRNLIRGSVLQIANTRWRPYRPRTATWVRSCWRFQSGFHDTVTRNKSMKPVGSLYTRRIDMSTNGFISELELFIFCGDGIARTLSRIFHNISERHQLVSCWPHLSGMSL
jgi:hypothetical protein